jgi:spermidine/putrescine transport system substrate-binding protein
MSMGYVSMHLKLAVFVPFLLQMFVYDVAGEEKKTIASKPILRILNWNEYIDIDERIPATKPLAFRSPTLLKFMKKYNCIIQYDDYMDTEDIMNNLKRFKQYDIVIVSNIELPLLIRKKLIQPVDKKKIRNFKHINKKYLNIYTDPGNIYSIPYLIGTTGIIYRRDLIGRAVFSLKDYFKPISDSSYKICLYDEPGIMVPFAMLYLRERISSNNIKGIRKAMEVLKELKHSGRIGKMTSDIPETRQLLLNGKVAIAIMYSGDALKFMEKNPDLDLAYILPEEGGEFYIDSFVVSAESKQKQLAFEFINFILKPENHAAIAMDIKYCSPNTKAVELIKKRKPEQLHNPAIYPPMYIMDKLYFFMGFNEESIAGKLWKKTFKKEHRFKNEAAK